MNQKIKELKEAITPKLVQWDHMVQSQIEGKAEIKEVKKKQNSLSKVEDIILEASIFVQKNTNDKISSLCTKALKSVFGENAPEAYLQFEQRRGNTEIDVFVVDSFDGKEEYLMDPEGSRGGGCVDVLCLALRVCCWGLSKEPLSGVFLMDEPFSGLSKINQHKMSKLIHDLSIELGLQFIIVTHEDGLTNCASAIFNVAKTDGVVSDVIAEGQTDKVIEMEADEITIEI